MSKQTMKIRVEFVVRGTVQWMGRTDSNGDMVDDTVYAAYAYIFGHQVAQSYGYEHYTEKSAIAECKRNLAAANAED